MKREQIQKLNLDELYVVIDEYLPEDEVLLRCRKSNQVLRIKILGGMGDQVPAEAQTTAAPAASE